MSDTYQIPPPAENLDQLMAQQGLAFVHAAYVAVMGRLPDPQGILYYGGRLRAGYAKLGLLDQLARSAEGRALRSRLPGLQRALARHRRGQAPLVGRVFRWLEGTEGNTPRERRERMLEQQVAQMSEDTRLRFEALDETLSRLRDFVANVPLSAASTSAPRPTSAAVSPLLASLSPRARPLFTQLQAAVALKQEEPS